MPVEAGVDASRAAALQRLRGSVDDMWDLIVVGGGATGLGIALDGASRGFRVLLLEGADFAAGTSCRSTKLLHGGVRYLAQARFGLVREALTERRWLLDSAGPVARPLPFLIPAPRLGERLWYGLGMKLYDSLSGVRGLEGSRWLDAAAVGRLAPGLRPDVAAGGVLYTDGQFDDAALAIALARAAGRHGALVLNYMRVTALLRCDDGRLAGVSVQDAETGEGFRLRGRCVVNATGAWVDALRESDRPGVPCVVAPSRGTHVVVSREHLPGGVGMLVPKTADGRVLFVLPWHGHLLLGTTDVALDDMPAPPGAAAQPGLRPAWREVDFILRTAARYLRRPPGRGDVLSAWSGVRPLVRPAAGSGAGTAGLSREHLVEVAPSGLVTVTGGKWTTFRRMAADVLDAVTRAGLLEPRPSLMESMSLAADVILPGAGAGGGDELDDAPVPDAATVRGLVRETQALTVEDVLARRYRWLFLDARTALGMARSVAEAIAQERGRDTAWVEDQCTRFRAAAEACLPPFD